MIKATYINNIKTIDNVMANRIYFGEEVCEKRIPKVREIKILIKKLKELNLKLTFVTPYVTNNGLEKLENIITLLSNELKEFEVVFNDWGVFYFIKNYDNIIPVCGRLLNKMKRDPRISNALNVNNVTIDYKNYFGNTNLNGKYIRNYLTKNNVERLEFDNVFQELTFKLPSNISGSIYYPYIYLTTTRLCRFHKKNLYSINHTLKIPKNCNQNCKNKMIKLKNENLRENIYLYGNTHYLKNKNINEAMIEKAGIDRIIYQQIL
jgi:hypothetical protein